MQVMVTSNDTTIAATRCAPFCDVISPCVLMSTVVVDDQSNFKYICGCPKYHCDIVAVLVAQSGLSLCHAEAAIQIFPAGGSAIPSKI